MTHVSPLLFLCVKTGYPSEFKFSLLTRERNTAYLRNIEQVQLLHALFEKANASNQLFGYFKAQLAKSINAFHVEYPQQTETQTDASLHGVSRKKVRRATSLASQYKLLKQA